MAKRKKIIITSNKDLYDKLNMLTFVPEVIVEDIKPMQIQRILNNINKTENIIDIERNGNSFTLKKINTINFKVYLR